MLYIIDIEKNITNIIYAIFEANTESTFKCTEELLRRIITENTIEIKNAHLIGTNIKVNGYNAGIRYHSITDIRETNYIVLCKKDKDEYKLVSHTGRINYMNTVELTTCIMNKQIHNCNIKDGKLITTDTYDAIRDSQFESKIVEKYKRYTALTAMLGQKSTFEYDIEGKVVRMKSYTERSKRVIIPDFITSINDGALSGCTLESVTLGSGVEYIGGYAFQGCELSEIVIPEQVKFIGALAFLGNNRLTKAGEYTERIKLQGKATLIIKRYLNE